MTQSTDESIAARLETDPNSRAVIAAASLLREQAAEIRALRKTVEQLIHESSVRLGALREDLRHSDAMHARIRSICERHGFRLGVDDIETWMEASLAKPTTHAEAMGELVTAALDGSVLPVDSRDKPAADFYRSTPPTVQEVESWQGKDEEGNKRQWQFVDKNTLTECILLVALDGSIGWELEEFMNNPEPWSLPDSLQIRRVLVSPNGHITPVEWPKEPLCTSPK